MTVIVTIDVPAEAFVLDGVLSANPGVHIELEPAVQLGSTCLSHVRVSGGHVKAVDSALREDSTIESFSIMDTGEEPALVRIEWAETPDGLVELMTDNGGTILEATGHHDTWTIRLRFVAHTALSTFYRQCLQRGHSPDLIHLDTSGDPDGADRSQALTDGQREALHLAFDTGHFEVPRRITLQELADDLSISDSAVSQRLRRGVSTLLGGELTKADIPGDLRR